MRAKRYHERIADDPLPRIVTTVTKDWIRYFSIPRLARLTYDQVLWSAERHRIHLYSFAVMPNHVHMVVSGTSTEHFMHSFKRYISREIGKWHDDLHGKPLEHEPVWQTSFNQLLIYGKESLGNRINYVANNAVKHGIVKNREEYPWVYVAPEYADWAGLITPRSRLFGGAVREGGVINPALSGIEPHQ